MGDIGEGASLDFAVLTVGFAQEDGGRGVAVGDGGDVHAYIIRDYNTIYKQNIAILHAYKIAANPRKPALRLAFQLKT